MSDVIRRAGAIVVVPPSILDEYPAIMELINGQRRDNARLHLTNVELHRELEKMRRDQYKWAALVADGQDELARLRAAARIRRALFWKPIWSTPRIRVLGLVLAVNWRQQQYRRQFGDRRLPFGWRSWRVSNASPERLVAPLWLAWPLSRWMHRREYAYRTLIRLGLWVDVPEDGYLHEGRWRWRRAR